MPNLQWQQSVWHPWWMTAQWLYQACSFPRSHHATSCMRPWHQRYPASVHCSTRDGQATASVLNQADLHDSNKKNATIHSEITRQTLIASVWFPQLCIWHQLAQVFLKYEPQNNVLNLLLAQLTCNNTVCTRDKMNTKYNSSTPTFQIKVTSDNRHSSIPNSSPQFQKILN